MINRLANIDEKMRLAKDLARIEEP
jgi:hypothetical protein